MINSENYLSKNKEKWTEYIIIYINIDVNIFDDNWDASGIVKSKVKMPQNVNLICCKLIRLLEFQNKTTEWLLQVIQEKRHFLTYLKCSNNEVLS